MPYCPPAPRSSHLGRSSRRRALGGGALLAASLLWALLACGGEGGAPSAPHVGPSQAGFALNAEVLTRAASAINVRVTYLRNDNSEGVLLDQTIALPLTGGRSLPVAVDLAPCLADPQHAVAGTGCRIIVTVRLLDASSAELDRVTLPATQAEPGATVSLPQSITLRDIRAVNVTAPTQSQGRVQIGQTLTLSAQIVDAAGATVTDRTVQWSSSNSGVARVDQSGVVTGVAAGTATITATVGARQGTFTVTVTPQPAIALTPVSLTFSRNATAANIAPVNVDINNSGGGALTGLSLGTPVFDPPAAGQPAPAAWLSATLDATTTPPRVVLRVTRTDLTPGTYTASIPVQSSAASNSPQTLRVTLVVTNEPVIALTPNTPLLFSGVSQDPVPAPLTVDIRNTGGGTLSGLTADVTYDTPNGQVCGGSTGATGPSNWLTVRLNQTTAPATLTVQPACSDLPQGIYSATVTLRSSVGGVAVQTIRVTLTIKGRPISRIAVDPPIASMAVGEGVTLTAHLFDDRGQEVFDRAVTWDAGGSSVVRLGSTSGLSTGVAGLVPGTASVSATSEGQSASATVTVIGAPTSPPGTPGTTPPGTTPGGGTPGGGTPGTTTPSASCSSGLVEIELRWGATPRDLDLHISGPGANGRPLHVFYARMQQDGVCLDNDIVTGFGPEKIQISVRREGTYHVYVHDYTNLGTPSSTALGASSATLVVRRNGSIVAQFAVPSGPGIVWIAFDIDATTFVVRPINTLSNGQGVDLSSDRIPTPGAEDDAGAVGDLRMILDDIARSTKTTPPARKRPQAKR